MNQTQRNSHSLLRQVVIVFASVGLLAAAVMMFIAWQHNSQGEIHDETGVHWGYWLFLGGTWFVFVGVLPALLASIVVYVSRIFRRK